MTKSILSEEDRDNNRRGDLINVTAADALEAPCGGE